MKIVTIIIATLIMNGCGSTKEAAADNDTANTMNNQNKTEVPGLEQDESLTMAYSAMTRGSFKQVTLGDSKLLVQRNRSEIAQDVSCNKEEWSKMIGLLKDIEVENLSKLEITSKAHQYDGALAATLTITKDGKTYQTPTFDHGKPPKEIEALVSYVLSLSKID